MKEEFKKISPERLELARGNTWSIENMAAHGGTEPVTLTPDDNGALKHPRMGSKI